MKTSGRRESKRRNWMRRKRRRGKDTGINKDKKGEDKEVEKMEKNLRRRGKVGEGRERKKNNNKGKDEKSA